MGADLAVWNTLAEMGVSVFVLFVVEMPGRVLGRTVL